MKHLLFLFIFIFTAGLSVGRSDAEESLRFLRLDEVLSEVVERNPKISAAKARSLAARERVPQALALDDPEFGMTRWEFPANFNIVKANETWYTLSQNLPFFGKRALRGRMADLERAAADEEFRAVYLSAITSAKQAYYDLFLADKAVEIHGEQLDLARRFSAIAREKFAVGEVGQQDVIRAQMELLDLSNMLMTLEQERETAAARLNALLNRPIASPLGTPETPTIPSLEASLEDLQSEAEENRPENRMQAIAVRRGEEGVKLAKREFLPDFMAEVGFMDMHDQEHDAWMATVRINLPWLNKEKYDARVRENEAERSGAEAYRQVALNETRFRVKDLFVRFQTAKRLEALYRDGILPLARLSLEAATAGYQTRKNDFLTLIEAQQNLRESELTYFRHLVDLNESVALLEEVVGRVF